MKFMHKMSNPGARAQYSVSVDDLATVPYFLADQETNSAPKTYKTPWLTCNQKHPNPNQSQNKHYEARAQE